MRARVEESLPALHCKLPSGVLYPPITRRHHSALECRAVQKNQLYYGDNLTVLREHIKDASVDLIYLDPPFNSRQDYNVLFAEKSLP